MIYCDDLEQVAELALILTGRGAVFTCARVAGKWVIEITGV